MINILHNTYNNNNIKNDNIIHSKIVAIQIDDIETLNLYSDSSLLIANELQKRGYKIFLYNPKTLYIESNELFAYGEFVDIYYNCDHGIYSETHKVLGDKIQQSQDVLNTHKVLNTESTIQYSAKVELQKSSKSADLFVVNAPHSIQRLKLRNTCLILIRQNPPYNMEYITTTLLLDTIKDYVLILNNPTSIRNNVEKLIPLQIHNKLFSKLSDNLSLYNQEHKIESIKKILPETLISNNLSDIKAFCAKHKHIVAKPLYGYGGIDIIEIKVHDNKDSKDSKDSKDDYENQLANILKDEWIIIQKFIPEVINGDIRVIVVDGKIITQYKRIPKPGSIKSNLAQGATPEKVQLNTLELELVNQTIKILNENDIFLAAIDILNGLLIEVNITSPTGLIQANRLYNQQLEVSIVDSIEKKMNK